MVERERLTGRIVRVRDQHDARVGGDRRAVRPADTRTRVPAERSALGRRRRRCRPRTCRRPARRRWPRDARTRPVAKRRGRGGQDAFVEPVREQDMVGGHAESARDCLLRGIVVGIERGIARVSERSTASTVGEQPAVFSFRCRRTPCFEPKASYSPTHDGRVRSRAAIDAACASSPSARASAIAAGASVRRPAAVQPLHGRRRARNPPRSGLPAHARRRSSGARGSSRSRSRPTPVR